MKKSKYIELVLITAALAACNTPKKDWEENNQVHLRSDTTAPYTTVHHYYGGGGMGNALLWYYAFRPYGNYYNGGYQRAGYYSGGISAFTNLGTNGFKTAVSRGGFGRSGFSVSS